MISSLKTKKQHLTLNLFQLTVPAQHAWNFIMNYIMNSPKVFLFQFESDGMEPSKRYSFISLLFILKWSIQINDNWYS